MGNDDSLAREVPTLRRKLVCFKDLGILHEAGPKHAELIVQSTGATHMTPLGTPTIRDREAKKTEERETQGAACGFAPMGNHLVKLWCRIETLCGLVRASAEMLGLLWCNGRASVH